ncbi:FtsX-like permease family protein [Georgenia subflava]|uniref:FtsX-like permease family protein n=1 Tax=Georgenia subflava TaxID=1622177 RepID=A0A6N7EJ39_9MICO|nr:FtsX-like permease family protein [Georgenia subflava]MPV37441.1 FtsX-like permease family protein [Georgenia subflava]
MTARGRRGAHPGTALPDGVRPGRTRSAAWLLLLRRQLRTGRGVHTVLALLVLLTTFVAVAAPRAADAAYDAALTEQLERALPVQRDLTVLGGAARFYPVPFTDDLVESTERAVRDQLGPAATNLLADTTFAAYTQPAEALLLPGGTQPAGEPVRLVLRQQERWTEHAELVDGRAPLPDAGTTAVDPDLLLPGEPVDVPTLELAVSDAAAQTLELTVGDALLLDSLPGGAPTPVVVRVVGVFRAGDPAGGYWGADPLALEPGRFPTADGGLGWLLTGLLAEDDYRGLASAITLPDGRFDGLPGFPQGGTQVPPSLTHAWRFVFDADALDAADVEVLTAAVGRVLTPAESVAPFPVRGQTGLPQLLERYEHGVGVTRTLVSVAFAAVLAIAGISVVLTALVAVDRRRDELRLLRSRGSSIPQLVGLVDAQALLWVGPAAVVGTVAGRLLTPAGHSAAPYLLAAAVLVLPLAVLPWAVRAATRVLHGAGDTRRTHPLARLGPEVALVLLAGLGAYSLRRRGLITDAGSIDPYAALVPTLVVLAVAVVVLRAYPFPVHRAAHRIARRSGAVAFLGLARASRERMSSVLPLVVLLLAVAVSVFASTVQTTVGGEQDRAAWREVGADVRVDDPALTTAEVTALADAPGVTGLVAAHRDTEAAVADGGRVTLLAVPPAEYAALLVGTPLAADEELADLDAQPPVGDAGTPLPALVSAPLDDAAAAGGPVTVGTLGRQLPLDVRAVVPALQRGADAEDVVVLVRLGDLESATNGAVEPTTALLRATDAFAVDDVLERSPSRDVADRVEVRAAVADAPLPSFLRAAFLSTMVLAAAYSVVAVVLLLALGAADRQATVARLRTMGMRPPQVRGLVAWELVPLAVAALLPGIAVGLALPLLLGPALDLGPFTGGPAAPPLRPGAAAVLGLGVGLVAVVAVAVLVDAARDVRASLSSSLRIGE